MSEFASLPDDSAEVERVFLWQEVVSVIRANAGKLGVQLSLESTGSTVSEPTRMVLAETPRAGKDTMYLWAEASSKALIAKATIIFEDDEGYETYSYEVTPNGISQYAEYPTALDQEDLQDLRMDVAGAEWDERDSNSCAENLLFLG